MKVDLYHLHRGLHFSNFAYPIMMDVLRVWAETVGWEARVSICRERHVDLDTDAGVVGFSVYTQTAPAVYRVARELRRRGKVVVLGGPHFRGPSTRTEASPFCDVLAESLCEEQWHALLADVAAGRLRAGRSEPLPLSDPADRFRYPSNFVQALRSRRWYHIPTIATSVGCPYDCSFCAAFMQGRYHPRSVDTIRTEVAQAPGRVVLFSDATFGLDKKFTIELMRALAPLGKKIAVETTLARLRDRELLAAMAHGGVRWCVIGIETLALRLRKHGSVDLEHGLRDVVARAQDLGVLVQGNFICGLDSDGPEHFDQIYECSERSGLDAVMIGILTPYPDTALYRRLDAEGRIFDRDWEHYDGHHVVYHPRLLTEEQLIDGYIALYQALRSRRPLWREAWEGLARRGPTAQTLVMIANNAYQKFDALKKMRLLRENRRAIRALRPRAAAAPAETAAFPVISPSERPSSAR